MSIGTIPAIASSLVSSTNGAANRLGRAAPCHGGSCERGSTRISRDGVVLVLGEAEAIRAARREIEAIALELQRGGIYRATVRSVRDFGVFVRIADHDGLVHQSAWGEGDHRQAREGDELIVRVVGADEKGRLVIERALDASEFDALNA